MRIQLENENTTWFLTGFDLMFGKAINHNPQLPYVIKSDCYIFLSFALNLIGLVFCFMKTEWLKTINLSISVAGITTLTLFQYKYLFNYTFSEVGSAQTDFCLSYWLLLLNFALIGIVSFIEKIKKTEIQNQEKTIININIITNSNSKQR